MVWSWVKSVMEVMMDKQIWVINHKGQVQSLESHVQNRKNNFWQTSPQSIPKNHNRPGRSSESSQISGEVRWGTAVMPPKRKDITDKSIDPSLYNRPLLSWVKSWILSQFPTLDSYGAWASEHMSVNLNFIRSYVVIMHLHIVSWNQ